jgi:hypothetical protein
MVSNVSTLTTSYGQMTALIVYLAGWRMCNRPQSLPPALDVALDHVIWLRMGRPGMTPQGAAGLIGARAYTWAQVVLAFAAAWEELPEDVRRGGNH